MTSHRSDSLFNSHLPIRDTITLKLSSYIFNKFITAIGHKQVTSLCLLYLSAIFDTIGHNILLGRLALWFVIYGTARHWLQSYLTFSLSKSTLITLYFCPWCTLWICSWAFTFQSLHQFSLSQFRMPILFRQHTTVSILVPFIMKRSSQWTWIRFSQNLSLGDFQPSRSQPVKNRISLNLVTISTPENLQPKLILSLETSTLTHL